MAIGFFGNGDTTPARRTAYPLLSLFDEVNRIWDETTPNRWNDAKVAFQPKIDIKETPKEILILGEFPGMKEEEIVIAIKDNTLTLSGEKKSEYEQKEGERTRIERSYGRFSREFQFGVELDEDNATAAMKNGVLTIRLPKSAKEIRGEKRLTIKAG